MILSLDSHSFKINTKLEIFWQRGALNPRLPRMRGIEARNLSQLPTLQLQTPTLKHFEIPECVNTHSYP